MDNNNNKLHVQKFLETHSLGELEAAHGVKSHVHGHKVSLNYSQIEAVDTDPLSQQCRGLILRKIDGSAIGEDSPVGETGVLARPFDRFFNHGQEAAANVDFSSPKTRFYEKLDGTCTILYFDSVVSAWHIATRAVSEADQCIDGFENLTFRTLFERALGDTLHVSFTDFVEFLDPAITYIFELTSPANRVVIAYDDYRITLLGARFNADGMELDVKSLGSELGIPFAPSFRFGSVTELVEFVASRSAEKHEGIVVCDAQYRRVKVKNAKYYALNRVQDAVGKSICSLLNVVLDEKIDDIIPLVPEHVVTRAMALRDGIQKLAKKTDALFAECLDVSDCVSSDHKDHATKKAFALAVLSREGWMAPLMSRYYGQCDNFYSWLKMNRVEGAEDMDGWSQSFLKNLLRQIT